MNPQEPVPVMVRTAVAIGIERMGTAVFQGAGIVFLAWRFSLPLPMASIGGAVLGRLVPEDTEPR